VIAVEGDLRDPDAIIANPAINRHLDFSEPVAVLLIAALHFVDDAYDPCGIVNRLMDGTPAGSCLALTHITADHVDPEAAAAAQAIYNDASAPAIPRTLAEVTAFFDGMTLLAPGVTGVTDWRPDVAPVAPRTRQPHGIYIYAGAAMRH
jgi:hypothetical protein